MNFLLNFPLEARLAGLFLLGAGLGGLLNLAIYRWAWNPRSISPWSAPPPKCPPRRWHDRLPVVGWFGLRREVRLHGRGFWIRPMLIELGTGLLLAALYWWEVEHWRLLPRDFFAATPPPGFMPTENLALALHMQFFSHAVLILLMLVASFIDIDEKIIPDTVTVPGAIIGLAMAAIYPWSLLPESLWQTFPGGPPLVDFLRITSPNSWPAMLVGAPRALPLLIGLGCWWLWCIGLMPRQWNTRRGYWRATQLLFARLAREAVTLVILAMGVVGSAAIALAWWLASAPSWAGLLTALVGMAVGGAMIWTVRIIGTATLQREAMGFGDVTLMAMIGTFMGWQPCLIIFLLAPLAGLVLGIIQWVLHRDNEIPYGPFLCLAALAVIVFWSDVWQTIAKYFAIWWLVPSAVVVCMILTGVLLGLWRLILHLAGREC